MSNFVNGLRSRRTSSGFTIPSNKVNPWRCLPGPSRIALRFLAAMASTTLCDILFPSASRAWASGSTQDGMSPVRLESVRCGEGRTHRALHRQTSALRAADSDGSNARVQAGELSFWIAEQQWSTHIFVIRALEALGEPRRLGVGDLRKFAGMKRSHLRLLSFNDTDLKTSVAGLLKDFLPVKGVKHLCRVLAGCNPR